MISPISFAKGHFREKSVILLFVLVIGGTLVVLTHNTEPELNLSSIDHETLKDSSKCTTALFQAIEANIQLKSYLKTEYVAKNHKALVNEIVGEIQKDYRKFQHDQSIPVASDLHDVVDEILQKKYSKKSFYDDILERVILKHAPETRKIQSNYKSFGYSFNNVWNPCFSKKFLQNMRSRPLEEEIFNDLQSKHDSLVEVLRDLPDPPSRYVHGDGIVINGGGSYLLGALTVIGQVREMGSKLPVELILAYESERDDFICDKLLHELNGRCVVIEREIGSALLAKLALEKFQLKSLSILVTSFDNVIMLDADNFPIQNVDELLTSKVYKSTKFLLWPDIWHKGTSPTFYEIARFKVGEVVNRQGLPNGDNFNDYIKRNKDTDIMMHDLAGLPPAMGVESGQMVFSKKAHWRSLLLSLYYNVNGYSHYYELLYQGTFGGGDRETFIPALHVMNEPYYLVRRECWLAGFKSFDTFLETTLVQYNPQESSDFFDNWEKWLGGKGLDTRLWPYQINDYTTKLFSEFKDDTANTTVRLPTVMFLHIHRPKINAMANAQPHTEAYDDIYTRRNLGLPGVYPEFGTTDWELKFHSISKWLVCKALKSKTYWRDIAKVPRSEVCDKVTEYVEFLKKDSPDTTAEHLKVIGTI